MDFKIYLYDENSKGMGIGNNILFENGEYLLASSVLKDNAVVFDVGSGRGDWAKMALNTYVFDGMHCFEPNKDLYIEMFKELFFRKNVFLNFKAVINKKGICFFLPLCITL